MFNLCELNSHVRADLFLQLAMTVARATWVIVGLLAMLAAALWLRSDSLVASLPAAAGNQAETTPSQRDSSTQELQTRITSQLEERREPAVRSGTLRIQVVDEANSAIDDAFCRLLQGSAVVREFSGDSGLVGRTDSDGFLEVNTIEHSPGTVLVFSHSGFEAKGASIEDLRRNPLVTLPMGHTQSFRCVDTSGNALGGCSISISQVGLPESVTHSAGDSCRGWPPEIAIYRAISGEDGNAEITGISAGRYRFRCERDDWAVVDSIADGKRLSSVAVPASQVTFTLAPVLIFLATVEGDDVLSHSYSFIGQWRSMPSQGVNLERVRSDVSDLFPGALGAVAATLDGHIGMTVPLKVALRRGGVRQFEVPGFPLSSAPVPLVIDCSGLEVEPRTLVRVSLTDVSGDLMDVSDLYALEGENIFTGIPLHPNESGELWLKPGRYELEPRWPPLRKHCAPKEVNVLSGNDTIVDVRLDCDFRKCLLEYVFAWGEVASEVHWECEFADGIFSFDRMTSVPTEYLIPAGPVKVTAKVHGRPTVSHAIEIPAGPWSEIFPITVTDPGQ